MNDSNQLAVSYSDTREQYLASYGVICMLCLAGEHLRRHARYYFFLEFFYDSVCLLLKLAAPRSAQTKHFNGVFDMMLLCYCVVCFFAVVFTASWFCVSLSCTASSGSGDEDPADYTAGLHT